MAWEDRHLFIPVLLLLLASDSWEQKPAPELLQKLEGETISLICPYHSQRDSYKVKVWCKITSKNVCTTLATSTKSWQQKSRYYIQDDRPSAYFKVTMIGLRTSDSGHYICETYHQLTSYSNILRRFHLIVSPASTPSTTRSTVRTTVWASTTSFAIDSPPGNWKIILPGVVLTVLLLLLLTVVTVLYLRKFRGQAGKGEDKSHHIYDDVSVQKETTCFEQLSGSDEDAGSIHYASLIHLNHFGTEDSLYVNTQSNWRPRPDPLLSVDYSSIAGNKPQPPKSPALEESLRK